MDEKDVLGEAIQKANKFNQWVKKNWFTVVGIIIILLVVLYEQTNIQEMREAIVDECNEYWHKQIDRSCPTLSSFSPQYPDNSTENKQLLVSYPSNP